MERKLYMSVMIVMILVTIMVAATGIAHACDLNVTDTGLSTSSGFAGATINVYGTYTGSAASNGTIYYVLPGDQSETIGTIIASGGNISGSATIPSDATEGDHLIGINLSCADNSGAWIGPVGTFTVLGSPTARNYYWTWYDSTGRMMDWVLMANPSGASGNLSFSLSIAGSPKILGDLGDGPGVVPPGKTLTPIYPGVIGGPVNAVSETGDKAIVSQRSLMGNSFEEVLGIDAGKLSDHFYWTWYDNTSLGMTNWVLVTNPNDQAIYYKITVGGQDPGSGSSGYIAAHQNVTPTFPGKIGGPVEVQAWTDNSESAPAKVMASQRVLSSGGNAFNEVPGIPSGDLSNDYLWTWYDNVSPDSTDWVLVANPSATDDVYYQIRISDQDVADGQLAPGTKATPTFPGKIGGPVEVKSCSAALDAYGSCDGTTPNVIASQRVLWGPSFEEVPGYPRSVLRSDYHWTWYDNVSPGSTNWILVANPSDNLATYEIKIGGVTMPTSAANPGTIPPHGRVTPTFPGVMNGPVEVTSTGANVMVSQRVLWNGYFNEVLGTVLN